ncbi:MAG TPA: Ig-like domain-containing protein [Candidatus Dormibacteraeota bacterium]|nr:Ig-like domain-containing protein [Candidatus Dormibacteraeota bacterium]
MVALRGGHGGRLLVWVSPLLAASASADAALAATKAPPPVPGRLVLRGRGGLAPEALQWALSASGARRVDAIAGIEGTVVEADDASLAAVAATLRRSGLFSSVEREQQARIAEPDDPYYLSQWGLPRGGVPAAWALSSGAGITVATKGSLLSGMVAIDVAANDNVAIGHVELFVDNRWYATMTAPPYSFVVDASALPAGGHKLRAYAYDTSNNVGKTKNLKVSFTPGTGLLVTHTVVKAASVSVSGQFALPAGVAFDPASDDVAVTLSSAGGTILAATARAGSFDVSGSGKMQGIVAPNVPSTGSVRLTAKSTGEQPLYTFKIRASNLSGMTAIDPLMNLGIAVGGIQLSQSLPCRSTGSTLLYP